MDSVRKLFRSVRSLFSSTPMPVPAAQQSYVLDTYCDRNASQNMASTVGGTGTSPIAIPNSVRSSVMRGSQVGSFEGDNRHNRRSPSRSRLFDTNESQDNYQHSPEQVFRTPNVSFERGTREFPQWGEETEVKQLYRPDRNNSRSRIAEDSRDEIFYLAPEYSDRQNSYRMGQGYYHTPPSRPTSRGRLRQNSPRLSNLRRRLDDDPYYERQPAQVRITNSGRDERQYENRDFGVMHNRKPRNADLFDDKNWDFDEYMAHFTSVARWNGWSYAEMADQLAMNLRGSARTVLGNLPEHEVRDFDSLKAAIQNLSKNQSKSGNGEQGKDQNFRRYWKDKPRGACFLCSQTDHYANLCPRNPKNAGSQTGKPSNGSGTGDNLNRNGLGSGPTVQPK